MQVNDFKNIQEAIKYEVLQDEKEYLKLLKVIGNNQKYDFSSQLSRYNKEPDRFDFADSLIPHRRLSDPLRK